MTEADHPLGHSEDQPFERRFEAIYADTYPSLVAYARRRLPSPSEADDVVAEVYTTAWRRRYDLESIDRSAEFDVLPWLYGIAANVVRNHRRSGGRRLRLVDRLRSQPSSVTTVAGTAEPARATGSGHSTVGVTAGPDDDTSTAIRAALGRLSFDDQEVLRLVAWEGLSHAEAGQALGCTTNAVGIRMHRARQRLAEELGDQPGSQQVTDRHRTSGES
jgi:RNA polymerase sigma-70 factor (ECF subfamily)